MKPEYSMKRMFALLMMAALACTSMMAQDDRLDELDFDEVPLEDEAVPYFAVGLGPVVNFAFVNLDELNMRADSLGLGEMSSPMIQWGVEAFTAIGLIPNVRVGFTWFNGTVRSDMTDSTGLKTAQEYYASSSSIVADYAFVLAKGLALIPGLGLGWSSQTISTYQAVPTRNWEDYGGISTDPDKFSELERGVWHVMPRVNLEYAFTPFFAIRGQAAYMLQFSSGDWIGNRVSTVSGVPDGINVNAFSAQIGLFVGLFN